MNRIVLAHVNVIRGGCLSPDVCTSVDARVLPTKSGSGFQINTPVLRLCISGMNSVVDGEAVIYRRRFNVRRVRLASIHSHIRITHVIGAAMFTRIPLLRLLLFTFAAPIMFANTSSREMN